MTVGGTGRGGSDRLPVARARGGDPGRGRPGYAGRADQRELSGGPGISVGRDFNSFSVGQNLTIRDGANITVQRDLGLNAQPAKGTGPSGQGIAVQGNLVIEPGSTIRIGRDLVGNISVVGNADIGAASGTPRISVGRNVIGDVIVRGQLLS